MHQKVWGFSYNGSTTSQILPGRFHDPRPNLKNRGGAFSQDLSGGLRDPRQNPNNVGGVSELQWLHRPPEYVLRFGGSQRPPPKSEKSRGTVIPLSQERFPTPRPPEYVLRIGGSQRPPAKIQIPWKVSELQWFHRPPEYVPRIGGSQRPPPKSKITWGVSELLHMDPQTSRIRPTIRGVSETPGQI